MNDTLLDDWRKLLATVPNIDVFRCAVRDLGKQVAKGRREKPKVVDDLISIARAHKLFGFDDEEDVEAIIAEGLSLGERDHEDEVDRDRLYAEADEKAARTRKGNGHDRLDSAPAEQATLEVWSAGSDAMPPPRGWVMGNSFCSGVVSSLIADGGVGKSALRILQAVSVATGRELTG
jgi:hypothetical protein